MLKFGIGCNRTDWLAIKTGNCQRELPIYTLTEKASTFSIRGKLLRRSGDNVS